MSEPAEVVIVGGGVMGASIAYHLARRRARPLLLEKESLLGTGATGRCAGGIRHQFSTRVNVELSLLSIRMLRRFERNTGSALDLNFCGYLFLIDNPADRQQFEDNVRMQRKLGVPVDLLQPEEIRALAPQLCLSNILCGTFCREDGLADPSGVVLGYARRAVEMGATIRTECPVERILVRNSRVVGVQTSRGRIDSEVVVIATGPWSGQLGSRSGLTLPVEPIRRQLAITRPLEGITRDFPLIIDFSKSLYFHHEGGGILTGMSDPDQTPGFDVSVNEEWRLRHFEEAVRRLPILEHAEIQTEWAGLYEVTPDHQPLLGRHPEVQGLVCCTGFSGHGFMHGPACGLLMAEEILDGRAHSINIDPLRYDRLLTEPTESEYNVV